MTAKRNVKLPCFIEPAQPVEAGAIQIIEQLRSLGGCVPSFPDELIKLTSMGIEALRLVGHLDRDIKTILKLDVEVYKVWIDVVEQRPLRLQSQGDRQSAAKRFNQTSKCVRTPEFHEPRQ